MEPGRLHWKRWPPSIGTHGRVQSDHPPAIVGIRIRGLIALPSLEYREDVRSYSLIRDICALDARVRVFPREAHCEFALPLIQAARKSGELRHGVDVVEVIPIRGYSKQCVA